MGSRGRKLTTTQSRSTVLKNVMDELNHSLPLGAESISNLKIGPIDDAGMADVEYEINYRIPYQETDSDGYTQTFYEYESEFVRQRRKVK